MATKETTNKYVNSPNVLKPTLVEFTDENYLKNALSDHGDKQRKITVIEIPAEWFNLYFNEKNIKIRCDTIEIKTLIKQKFSKIKDTDAFLVISEEFAESDFHSRKRKINVKNKYYSVEEYKNLIEHYEFKTDPSLTDDENYLKFLNDHNSMALHAPDIDHSLFKDYQGDKQWNLNKFKSIIHRIKKENGEKVPGIHTPYMCFGSTFSMTPSHRKDGNFLSINIHYYGADKIWFMVNEEDGVRFQNLVNELLLKVFPKTECRNLMDHKLFIVTEQFLQKNKIHYTKVIQKPRTIIVTHPFGIHGGFNLGFNITEAVNFATIESVKYFANYRTCTCDEIVRLNGERIIKEKYPTYYALSGSDNQEENHTVLGNPDDPEVIEKKKKQREINLAAGRRILAAKRSENREFSLSTTKHWLNFTLNCNPYPHLKYPNEKLIRSFKSYCRDQGHSLLDYENCNSSTFKSRVFRQIYEPIMRGEKKFDLSDEDLEKIIEKLKK